MSTPALTITLSGDDSQANGYTDGELAAITGLTTRRLNARAAMAADHDRDYARGLIDGYHATLQLLA